MMVIGGAGSRCRARMLMTMSAEWPPSRMASWRAPLRGAGDFAADQLQCRRQHPVLERRAVAQRTGLADQHRHIVPGIEYRLVATEAPGMLAHQPSVLAQFDPLGIRADLHRPPNRMGRHRVAVVVEADET